MEKETQYKFAFCYQVKLIGNDEFYSIYEFIPILSSVADDDHSSAAAHPALSNS